MSGVVYKLQAEPFLESPESPFLSEVALQALISCSGIGREVDEHIITIVDNEQIAFPGHHGAGDMQGAVAFPVLDQRPVEFLRDKPDQFLFSTRPCPEIRLSLTKLKILRMINRARMRLTPSM